MILGISLRRNANNAQELFVQQSSSPQHAKIDEAWSDLTGQGIEGLREFGRTVKARVYQYTGLPVRVAIAPTKSLTKIACELLKSDELYGDVLDMTAFTEEQLDHVRSSCHHGIE